MSQRLPAEFLFEFGGSAKLNLVSVIGDAITTALIGVPLVSTITGWDNLTLSADVRFDLLFPVKEVNGPGIGRIVLGNKIEKVNYGCFKFADKFLGLIPISIKGELRHAERPVVESVATYKDHSSAIEKIENYIYNFEVSSHQNIYCNQVTLYNGRLHTDFYYSAYEEEGSKLISWSDHIVENLRTKCLIQPYYIMRTYSTSIEKSAGSTLLEKEYFTWSDNKTRIISKKTERAPNQFIETEYAYDNWGNITSTNETVRAGSRVHHVTQNMYYFDPESATQWWIIHSSNPYENEHNSLSLSVKRYDLLLGKVMRNYLSPDDIPAAYKPVEVTFSQYKKDMVSYYNYDECGRMKNESVWSDAHAIWIEKDYYYDRSEGYVNRIVSDTDIDNNVKETHETNIIHDYSDQNYYTITTSMNVTTPDGDDIQNITVETGYEKATGYKVWEKDARGYYTTYVYDGFGRILKTEKPSDNDSADYNPVIDGLDRNNNNPEMNIEYSEIKDTEGFYT